MSFRVPCSVCRRIMPVTTAGLVRVHGPVSNRCPGSRNPPTVTSTAAPASISAFTTDSLQEQGPVTQQLAESTIQLSLVFGHFPVKTRAARIPPLLLPLPDPTPSHPCILFSTMVVPHLCGASLLASKKKGGGGGPSHRGGGGLASSDLEIHLVGSTV